MGISITSIQTDSILYTGQYFLTLLFLMACFEAKTKERIFFGRMMMNHFFTKRKKIPFQRRAAKAPGHEVIFVTSAYWNTVLVMDSVVGNY